MPVYQYKCRKCNKVTEEFSQIQHSEQVIDCAQPMCIGMADRIISLSHFQFADGLPSYQHDEGGPDSLEEAEEEMRFA